MDRKTIEARIAQFVAALQALYDAEFAAKYAMLVPSRISVDAGGIKYRRIVVTCQHRRDGVVEDGQRSVYCFIDMSNGDILKAEGWKGPAKGARGNIFNENCDVGTKATMYGSGLYR